MAAIKGILTYRTSIRAVDDGYFGVFTWYIQLHYFTCTFSISLYFFFSLVVKANEAFENSYSATSLSFLIHHSLHISCA
jgi:hypothetical protein